MMKIFVNRKYVKQIVLIRKKNKFIYLKVKREERKERKFASLKLTILKQIKFLIVYVHRTFEIKIRKGFVVRNKVKIHKSICNNRAHSSQKIRNFNVIENIDVWRKRNCFRWCHICRKTLTVTEINGENIIQKI